MEHPLWIDSLFAFVVAASIAGIVGCLLLWLPWFSQSRHRDDGDRSGERPRFYRLGGVILAAGFFAAFAYDERLVWDPALHVLVFGSCAALALGLIDDFVPLRWWQQLLGQAVIGGSIVQSGMLIHQFHFGSGVVLDLATLYWLPPLVTLLWILVVMNAVNWLDGTDGLMGSVVSIALGVLAVLSMRPEVNQPTLFLIILMLLGAIVGFLFFNWQPARVVAGSSGSLFIGFLLAALSIYAGTKVATVLMVLALPILDFFSVILTRIHHGRSPFLPDRSHLHFIFLSLGWSPNAIALCYVSLTIAMGTFALTTRYWEKVWVFLISAAVFSAVLAWMQWILNKRVSRN